MMTMQTPAARRRSLAALAAMLAALGLSACSKLDHFGKPPTMSSVAMPRDSIDPTLPPTPIERRQSPIRPELPHTPRTLVGPGVAAAYGAERGEYLPARPAAYGSTGPSLWNSGPTSLFGDRRARTVGDILTILIEIDDKASLSNTTTRARTGTDSVTASTVFGLESLVDRLIPGDAVGLANGVETNGDSTSTGEGTIARDESISLRIAATVVDVLPNGHLVVTGNQEVRVNFELRDLQVAGIIRPEDITRQNTITYDKMANARIMYGGRGQITDFQQPRLGQQLVDLISPF